MTILSSTLRHAADAERERQMETDEIYARQAIDASVRLTGSTLVSIALWPRIGGFDALVLADRGNGHVSRYVVWKSHFVTGERSLPGVYSGLYALSRKEADEFFNARYGVMAEEHEKSSYNLATANS